MSNLDGFEKIVKDKLQQQQYDYDSSQWNAIEKRLPPPKKGFPWKYCCCFDLYYCKYSFVATPEYRKSTG